MSKVRYTKTLSYTMMTCSQTRIAELESRIAELEKENETLKKEKEETEDEPPKSTKNTKDNRLCVKVKYYADDEDDEDPDQCVKCDRTFNQLKTIFNDGDNARWWNAQVTIDDEQLKWFEDIVESHPSAEGWKIFSEDGEGGAVNAPVTRPLCAECLGKWKHKRALKALSCEELKDRLRALNQPVKKRGELKADLIERILECEELTEALFRED